MQMTAVSADPFILTLDMDAASQQRFNELRRAHFPRERNYLDAHLTLFHHLPAEQPAIIDLIDEVCKNTPVFHLQVTGIFSLGGGVAFRIEDDRLTAFHQILQQQWNESLTAQDKQKRRFHVTVQNKVTVQEARDLLQQLQADFQPFSVTGTGVTLWSYKQGPWEWYRSFPLLA